MKRHHRRWHGRAWALLVPLLALLLLSALADPGTPSTETELPPGLANATPESR